MRRGRVFMLVCLVVFWVEMLRVTDAVNSVPGVADGGQESVVEQLGGEGLQSCRGYLRTGQGGFVF